MNQISDTTLMNQFMSRVIIRNNTEQEGNIHLAVNPFPFGQLRSFMHNADDHLYGEQKPLTDDQCAMRDALFALPGVSLIAFKHGEITVQHVRVIDDHEMVLAAVLIILPFLYKARGLTEGQVIALDAVASVMGLEYFQRWYGPELDLAPDQARMARAERLREIDEEEDARWMARMRLR